jgi:hypothetical protein
MDYRVHKRQDDRQSKCNNTVLQYMLRVHHCICDKTTQLSHLIIAGKLKCDRNARQQKLYCTVCSEYSISFVAMYAKMAASQRCAKTSCIMLEKPAHWLSAERRITLGESMQTLAKLNTKKRNFFVDFFHPLCPQESRSRDACELSRKLPFQRPKAQGVSVSKLYCFSCHRC